MNEFVTQCGRDRVPIIWFQDTTGIDVGDIAEKAELLGLGQSLIYSIEQTMCHDVYCFKKRNSCRPLYHGGPQANNNNAFTLAHRQQKFMSCMVRLQRSPLLQEGW